MSEDLVYALSLITSGAECRLDMYRAHLNGEMDNYLFQDLGDCDRQETKAIIESYERSLPQVYALLNKLREERQ